MHRNKVIDLAREAGLFSTEAPILVPKLERFAALIEAEMCKYQADKFCETHCSWTDHHVDCDQVRGDAEPVAWMSPKKERLEFSRADTVYGSHTIPLYTHPAPAASAESVASVHIKDGCLIGSQRKSGVDIPDGQYALYPIGTFPAPAVDVEPVGYTNEGYKGMQYANAEAYKDIRPDFIERNKLTAPLYKHPAPAVVRQLVEAAKRAMNYAENVVMAEGVYFDHDDDLPFIESALAAAKETGI